jgi:hypothetical protein
MNQTLGILARRGIWGKRDFARQHRLEDYGQLGAVFLAVKQKPIRRNIVAFIDSLNGK